VGYGDKEKPTGQFLFEHWSENELIYLLVPKLAGYEYDSWAAVLSGSIPTMASKKTLYILIDGMEEAIGKTLGSFLKDKGIRRITIIPHWLFHLVPFWALPSLMQFDIIIATNGADFISSHHRERIESKNALVVGDPILDLPLSICEVDSTTNYLSNLGMQVERLQKENATKQAIIKKLSRAGIFHFCGHGVSSFFIVN